MKNRQDEETNNITFISSAHDTASVAVLGVDHTGTIFHANQLVTKLFQLGQDHLIGQSIETIFPPALSHVNKQLHAEFLPQIKAQSTDKNFDLMAQRTDGTVVPIRAGVNTFSIDDSRLVMLTLQDLSLYYETEEAVLAKHNRIARKLHDSVSQTLFSASMIANVLPQLWQEDVNEGEARVRELQRLTRSAMLDMQTLLHELRPLMLIDIELDELLHQLVEMLQSKNDISIHFDICGSVELPVPTRIGFYRIAQEALSNVSQHANATHIDLVLKHDAEYTSLKIADDGCGFDIDCIDEKQPGLSNMRERAREIGANLKIESQPSVGTTVLVQWPSTEKMHIRNDNVE